MKALYITTFLFVGGFAAWMSGCAPVQFSSIQANNNTCSAACPSIVQGKTTYDYDVNDSLLPIDILFVSDNSGSMSIDQETLGSKFPTFFNMISGYDYHVAITTTDVVTTGRAGSSGSLVQFSDPNHPSYLGTDSANVSSEFSNGVVRPETLTCDNYLKTHNCSAQGSCSDYDQYCPSDDSRAIFAANMVVAANQDGWMRSSAPLHVIILSNADERIEGGQIANMPLESNDEPDSLTTNYPGKTIKIHTLVIQPGDSACLAAEHRTALIFGQYAPVYHQAAADSGGVNGSICANPYDTQLQQMGLNAQANLQSSIPLKCATSQANLTYSFSPSSSITATVDSTGQILNLSSPLPQNITLHLNYICN